MTRSSLVRGKIDGYRLMMVVVVVVVVAVVGNEVVVILLDVRVALLEEEVTSRN